MLHAKRRCDDVQQRHSAVAAGGERQEPEDPDERQRWRKHPSSCRGDEGSRRSSPVFGRGETPKSCRQEMRHAAMVSAATVVVDFGAQRP